jgi:WD40 repeat protein
MISEFPSGNNPVTIGADYYDNVAFDVSDFSPDGKQLLIGDDEGKVKLWDATTGSLIKTFLGHTSTITGLAFSPDGTKIASTSDDRTAKLWDVASGTLLTTFSPSAGPVKQVAFSADNKILALGTQDGAVRFYFVEFDDLLTLARTRITRSFTDEECQTYLHVAECPDGLPQPRPYSEASADLDISALPAPAMAESGTPLHPDNSLRDQGLSTEVTIQIINSADKSLEFYWVDENGVEQFYDSAKPGQDWQIIGSEGVPWRAYDEDGNLWFEYVATDQETQVLVIGPDMKVTVVK